MMHGQKNIKKCDYVRVRKHLRGK